MSEFKKIYIPLLVLLLLFSSLQVSALEIIPLKLLRQAERTIYGQELDLTSLVERIEMLEKTLYGEKGEGSLQDRAERILNFVFGDEENPSLILTINTLEWTVSNKISQDETLKRINSLEKTIFGTAKTGPIVNRVKEMQRLSFPDGKLPFEKVKIPGGFKINIELMDEINSEKAKVGDRFKYIVTEDVILNGNLIIPENTVGWVEVTKVKKAGHFGQDGKVQFEFPGLMAIDGTYLPVDLSDEFSSNLYSREIAVGVSLLGAALFNNPIGLAAGYFVKGKNEVLPVGYEMELATERPVIISSPDLDY